MRSFSITFIQIFYLSIFLIFSLSSCSHEKKFEHPKSNKIINDINVTDSLNFLSSQVLDSSKNLSYQFANYALVLSKSIHYAKGEGYASLNLGIFFLYMNQFSTSLKFLYDALNIAHILRDTSLMTNVYIRICENYIKLQKPDNANFYIQKYFKIAIFNQDTLSIIEALRRESDIYNLKGKSDSQLISLYRALWFSNKINDFKKIIRINKHIGNYYMSKGNYRYAEYYYRKSINISFDKDFLVDIGTLYSLLSHIYTQEMNFNEALRYNKLALKIRQQIQQEDQVASSFLNLGRSYLSLNKTDSALIYFSNGLDLANKLNIELLQEAGNKYLYELYLQREDWKNALKYYRSFIDAKDSMSLAKKKQESALIEANQIINEKEKKTELLEAENQLQKTKIKYNRIQIILLSIIVLIVIGMLIYIYRQYLRNKKSKIALQKLNEKLDMEIEERKQAENQLRKSEALHSFLTNNSLDVIARIDNKNKVAHISPSCLPVFGYNQSEMLEMDNFNTLIDIQSAESLNAAFLQMLKRKESAKFTYRVRKKDGSLFWAESHVNPFFNKENGELTEMIAVIRDISERIAFEEALQESDRQKEMLMREIHHRAKNNFAILISLLSIQKIQSKNQELDDILSDLQTRIRTMVLIHEQLYKSNSVDIVSFGQYIINLVNIISNAFRKEGIALHSEISECMLNIDTALPLGLIVNELLTNSFKYAFTGRSKGNIHVKLAPLAQAGQDNHQSWELIIEDDGVGLPVAFSIDKPSSMGSQIIQALITQIHAQLEISGKEGASFRLIFQEQHDA